MSPFFTANGDDGSTGLLKGGRVRKHHPIPEAVGAMDEANSAFALARSVIQDDLSKKIILTIQKDLRHLMAEISASPENALRFRKINSERVKWLEDQIDILVSQVQMPDEFIVPGDSLPGAALDLARTTVRRAERRAAILADAGIIDNMDLLRYLNRLSSLCFILELYEDQIFRGFSSTIEK